jgi:polyferredoxin
MWDAVNTGMLPYFGLGLLAIWFIVAGRLFCGKACPLGMIQALEMRNVEKFPET